MFCSSILTRMPRVVPSGQPSTSRNSREDSPPFGLSLDGASRHFDPLRPFLCTAPSWAGILCRPSGDVDDRSLCGGARTGLKALTIASVSSRN